MSENGEATTTNNNLRAAALADANDSIGVPESAGSAPVDSNPNGTNLIN